MVDTAGIRSHASDIIEELGIKKSKNRAQEADFVIFVIDASYLLEIENIDLWLQKYTQNMKVQCNNNLIFVNKTDLVSEKQILRLKQISQASNWIICFGSCIIDNGLVDMMKMFENCLQKL